MSDLEVTPENKSFEADPNLDTLDESTLNVAAERYGVLVKGLENRLVTFSKKGLQRVILALAKVPLEDFNGVMDAKEKDLYFLLSELLQYKFVLVAACLQMDYSNNEEKKEETENVEMAQGR